MSVSASLVRQVGYLEVIFSGEFAVLDIIEKMTIHLPDFVENMNKKLLIDFTALAGDISILDRYELGKLAFRFKEYDLQAAILLDQERMDPGNTGEKLAVALGVKIRVRSDKEELIAWLRGGDLVSEA